MSDKKEPEKKKKSEVPVWFVRGVSIELRAEVAAAAERAGMNIGTWAARALRAALDRPEGQGGARVGQGDAGDLAERVADLAATVEVVRALFEKHRRQDFPSVVERIERLEAQVGAAIPDRQGRQGSALDAVESAEGVKMPEKTEARPRPSVAGRRRSPRPWTDADWIELRRIFDRGGTQAEAERELGRPSSVISRRWRELEREVQAEAEAGPGEDAGGGQAG
jgi:hypothetical protein